MDKLVSEIKISEFPLFKKGKVRDVYDLGDKLLIVATDRISAFDFVLPSLIPNKGKVLTQLSRFWFDFTAYICPNHVLTADFDGVSRSRSRSTRTFWRNGRCWSKKTKCRAGGVCGPGIPVRLGMEANTRRREERAE